MTVHPHGIAILYPKSLQLIQDPVILQETLEEKKAFFRIQIGIAQHLFYAWAFEDIFIILFIIGYGVRLDAAT